ncbi:hypothetical protein OCU04_004967 [Sclerotinia nivalis]|uniref:Alternative oxidase n=1 Tax=Sclerotinia nivalis TaxID=352851 RepID=A0A9X0DKN6_9HELO|nr:hypothetical protein OCU04_004967 [Sclerotinia nivalis]
MRLPVNIKSRHHIFLVVLIIFSICFYIFLISAYDLPAHIIWQDYLKSTLQPTEINNDIFNFPPASSRVIRAVCETTRWNPEIAFTCDNSVGGVGNIRNSILNCVRYAISAGASLVIPRIILRKSQDISKIRTGERTGMDFMFDVPHFIDSLKLSCPQLVLYRYVDDVPNRAKGSGPITLLPESLFSEVIPKTGLEHPETWRGLFQDWLDVVSSSTMKVTMETPVLIELGRSYLQYPIYSDDEDFALSFGSILKFRQDVRILATTVLQNLLSTYNILRDISHPILPDAFFGVHLRTEIDAVKAWPGNDWIYQRYKVQAKHYLHKIASTNLTLIYVASGNKTEIARFSRDAAAYNLTTKFMLLDAKDREHLNTLAWDQQALVDFLVMTKSSVFVGIGHSSFAWNVALKRHVYSEMKEGYLDGPEVLSDELSEVFGVTGMYPEYAACLWP